MARGPIPDFPRDRPTVPEVTPLVAAYWNRPGNGNGGCLHVVLDDGNINLGCIEGSIDLAIERRDAEAVGILTLLSYMTTTQRRRLIWSYRR